MSNIYFKKYFENININKASKDLLKKLPYVGNKRADKIIAHRPYKSKNDLKKVFGKSLYGHIRIFICVSKEKQNFNVKNKNYNWFYDI